MPEFDASRLDPSMRPARGDARMVVTVPEDEAPGVALLPPNETWRHIQAMAKFRPAGAAAPSPVVPTPAPAQSPAASNARPAFEPDETLLRQRLAELRAELAQVEAALVHSQAAHERGEAHLQACTKKAAQFAGLDARMSEALAGALRDGTPEPSFIAESSARDAAVEDVRRATAAVDLLRAEHGRAASEVGTAKSAISVAVTQILAALGEQEAVRRQALVRECEQSLERLMALSHVPGVVVGPATRSALFPLDQMVIARPRDTSVWTALAERLRADPAAALIGDNP
jgi:hypothetical protein